MPKAFKCNICQREFTRNSSLKRHIDSFHQSSPYQVPLHLPFPPDPSIDPYQSSYNRPLDQPIYQPVDLPSNSHIDQPGPSTFHPIPHTIIHPDPDPPRKNRKNYVQCPRCQKYYSKKFNLIRHMNMVHNGYPESVSSQWNDEEEEEPPSSEDPEDEYW